MTSFAFQKCCNKCKQIYFTKLISKESFDNLADIPDVVFHLTTEPKTATLISYCDVHVDDHFSDSQEEESTDEQSI